MVCAPGVDSGGYNVYTHVPQVPRPRDANEFRGIFTLSMNFSNFFFIRRFFNLRGASREVWNRGQRSWVPYRRTSPSVNLAYHSPADADLLTNEAAHSRHDHLAATANQAPFQGSSTRTPRYHQTSPLRNQWLSQNPPIGDPPSYTNPSFAPPPRICAIPENSSTGTQIYSNIQRLNRPHLKVTRLQSNQNEPVASQHQSEMFPYENSTQSPSGNPYRTTSAPWLCGDTSYFTEDAVALQPPKFRIPRTPDSPFTTINPMYHSRPPWGP